jgi:subtilase family serine protease
MTKKILAAAIVLSLVFVLGCSEISGLAADLTCTSKKTFTWTAQTGSHALKVIANSNEKATESDEPNNAKIAALSVTSPPNLVIEAITWSPAYPTIGDTVTFTVTIKNQGSSKASYSYIAYYIDDAYLTSALVSPIDPSATVTKTFLWKAQAGPHTVKAIADANNEVTESDETNNVKTYMFSTLAPDLIIESITWSPAYPTIGDTVTFTVTIKNQGSSKASYSYVAYYIERPRRWVIQVAYLTSASVSPIDPGATDNKTFTWTAQTGRYVFHALIDKGGQSLESDESNNEKSTVILSILSVFLSPVPTPKPAPSPAPPAPAPTSTLPAPPAPSASKWPLIGGIIAATVILALLIFFLVRRSVFGKRCSCSSRRHRYGPTASCRKGLHGD